MAEWFKAFVLKTNVHPYHGFESRFSLGDTFYVSQNNRPTKVPASILAGDSNTPLATASPAFRI